MTRTSLSIVLVAACLGCGTYGKDRALDFAQSCDASAGFSEGLALNLRATKVLQAGFGSYRGTWWAGLKDGVFDVWMEERAELGISLLYELEYARAYGTKLLDYEHPIWGDPGYREWSWDQKHLTDRGFFDFGFTVNAAIIGFDLAFKGGEFCDFVAGVFGADPFEDDVHEPTLDALRARANSDDARQRKAALRALLIRTGDDYGYAVYTAPREMPRRQMEALRRLREGIPSPPREAEAEPVEPAPEEPASAPPSPSP